MPCSWLHAYIVRCTAAIRTHNLTHISMKYLCITPITPQRMLEIIPGLRLAPRLIAEDREHDAAGFAAALAGAEAMAGFLAGTRDRIPQFRHVAARVAAKAFGGGFCHRGGSGGMPR